MARINKKARKNPNKTPIEEDCSDLPCDIIENILARLPVKSLVRFKSVCRSWNSIISNPVFARIHLKQSKKAPIRHLFLWRPNRAQGQFNLVRYENGEFRKEATCELPIKKYKDYTAVFSCDGLVLLTNPRSKLISFVLWNPLGGIYTSFTSPFNSNFYSSLFGLCLDPSNDNYKVVLISVGLYWYAIFSVANKTWTEKKALQYRLKTREAIFHNGTSHWVGKRNQGHDNEPLVVVFLDPCDDELKHLPIPQSAPTMDLFPYSISLVVLRGCLCLYHKSSDRTKLDLWMMKEYGNKESWMKFVTIRNNPAEHYVSASPLYLTPETEVLYMSTGYRYIVYNKRKKKFGKFKKFLGFGRKYNFNHAEYNPFPFLDSLCFPGKGRKAKKVTLAVRT